MGGQSSAWRAPVLAAAAAAFASLANAYAQVEWSNRSFGPDGPWNAVELQFQYTVNDTLRPLALIPALTREFALAFAPAPASCSDSTTSNCGIGGTVNPPANLSSAGTGWQSSYDPNFSTGKAWQYNYTGYELQVNVTIPGFIIYNSAIIASTSTTYGYPNGKSLPAEVGLLNLGGDPNYEIASISQSLFQAENQLIVSNSFGLHLGSGPLGFPGSLVFGGYDSGRIIGPLISFSAGGFGTVEVQDIIIDVEIGGSPFSFQNKTNLLKQDSSSTTAQPLQAELYLNVPYIAVPQATVDGIVRALPVYLDASGYYLWDTTNPSYSKIINSPAYLGFVIPSGPGAGSSITIKVPFALLNMTLESQVTGYDSDRAYLPIVPVTDAYPSQDRIWLGRAFFQAAYYAVNWNNNASWIAQAPGPGTNNQGLGSIPQDMANGATDLGNIQSGDSVFQQSWMSKWTVLPDNSSPSNGSSGNNGTSSGDGNSGDNGSSGSSGLSGGAIGGIVVGVVVGLGLLAGLLAFILIRRRRKYRATATEEPNDKTGAPAVAGQEGQENQETKYTGGDRHYSQQWGEQQHMSQMPPPQWSPSYSQQSPGYPQHSPQHGGGGFYPVPSELAAPDNNGAKELHADQAPPSELPAEHR